MKAVSSRPLSENSDVDSIFVGVGLIGAVSADRQELGTHIKLYAAACLWERRLPYRFYKASWNSGPILTDVLTLNRSTSASHQCDHEVKQEAQTI